MKPKKEEENHRAYHIPSKSKKSAKKKWKKENVFFFFPDKRRKDQEIEGLRKDIGFKKIRIGEDEALRFLSRGRGRWNLRGRRNKKNPRPYDSYRVERWIRPGTPFIETRERVRRKKRAETRGMQRARHRAKILRTSRKKKKKLGHVSALQLRLF